MIDITELIGKHGSGALFLELNDSLAALIRDCCDTGKKGKLTLSLVVEPVQARDNQHQVKFTPNVTTNNPKYDAGVEFYFVQKDEHNNPVGLQTEDPRQMAIFEQMEKDKR